MTGPYSSALAYWGKGWRGVLPIPHGAKHPPPEGWTGANAPMPSMPDVYAWLEERSGWNIAIRLPDGVIGLDVDDYGGKHGWNTLRSAEGRWGALPATWSCTSRDDGVSGIRLYRVPDGLRWPGELGPNVEIIQHRHRYMVAPPSMHPSGAEYRWLWGDPSKWHETGIPALDELPWLPEAWVEGLTGGALAVDIAKAELGDGEAQRWLEALPGRHIQCRAVQASLRRLDDALASGRSRHDATLRTVMHLTRLGAEGHTGVPYAVEDVGKAFLRAVSTDGSRSFDTAHTEWRRILTGAVAVVQGSPDGGSVASCDPCVDPWGDLGPRPGGQHDHGGVATPDLGSAQASGEVKADEGDSPSNDLDALREQMVLQELERLRARRAAIRRLDDEERSASWREPPTWDLPTYVLQAESPLPYAVDELMPQGANVLITAQYKTGKTTLMVHLAKCMADGKEFLGTFPTTAQNGRIALWNYEVSSPMFARWLRRAGIEQAERVCGIDLRGYRVPLGVPGVTEWCVEWLRVRQVRHWIVDPWGRAIAGYDENSNSDVGDILDTLDEIKLKAGVVNLILATHTGRAVQEIGAERARGATRLDDWADVRWLLTAKDGVRYFRAHGRDVDLDEGELEYDELMGALRYIPGSNREDEEPSSAEPRRKGRPPKGRNIPNELLIALQTHPGMSAIGLATLIKARPATVGEDLRIMEQQGLIVHSGEGRSSRFYLPGDHGLPVP